MPDGAKEVLEFSISYVTRFGYLGVAFIFLAMAYFLRRSEPRVKYVLFSTGFALLLGYGILEFIAQWFPDKLIARSILAGRIVHVPQGLAVKLSVPNKLSPGPYVRRENDPSDIQLASYFFISTSQYDYRCMTVAIGGPDPEPHLYSIPINMAVDTSAKRELVVTVKEASGIHEATLAHYDGTHPVDAKETNLKSVPLNASGCDVVEANDNSHRAFARYFHFNVMPTAMAQDKRADLTIQTQPNLTYDDFESLLRSDDPFVRRDARTALAQRGSAAIPIIKKLILQSDYRLQLGALVALGQLIDLSPITLSPDLLATVERLSAAKDPTMSSSAQKIINAASHPSNASRGLIGIKLTCQECPPSLDLGSVLRDVGISVSTLDKEPAADPTTYVKVSVDSLQAMQWLSIDMPAPRAKVRLVLPDADSKLHPNMGLGHRNKVEIEQTVFELAAGEKALVSVDLRPEIWYELQRSWRGYGRVVVENLTVAPMT